MVKVLKSIAIVIFAIIACASFILMVAENPDGSMNLTWSLGWLAALLVSTKILEWLGVFKEEVRK